MLKKLRFFLLILAVSAAGCFPQTKKVVPQPEPVIRVLLATLAENDSLFFRSLYVLRSEEAHYEFGERNQQLNIVPLKSGIQLYNQNRNLLYRNYFPIRLEPAAATGRFVFRGKEYSGTIMFAPAADAVLYLINELPLEEYLKGVLPAEINTIRTPYLEAMKAQAVCSRTYALKRIQSGETQNRPYDLESTVVDQVYTGFDRHTELADRAIAETRGICITYQGEIADIFYHSTCGGRLEPADRVWPAMNAPYLSGGIDAVSDTFSCSSSPFFRWRETRSLAQLDSSFYSNYGRSLLAAESTDTLYLQFDLRVKQRSSSGRVEQMEITYCDTTVELNSYEVRRFFAADQEPLLRSTLFFFTQPDDTTLEIHGAGYGHGVGMCQYGAMDMSAKSFRYYHIISKYFPGTTLVKKY
jgi:stage II sporulation protein D